MNNEEVSFYVAGVPQPGGSKKAFYNPKIGRAIITEDNPKSKPWRAAVAAAASEVFKEVLDGPLHVRFEFFFTRPKGHYRTGKNSGMLKTDAPAYPDVRPDASKCTRSSEDALKGIAWRDDSQIVSQFASKRYADSAGARITVRRESE